MKKIRVIFYLAALLIVGAVLLPDTGASAASLKKLKGKTTVSRIDEKGNVTLSITRKKLEAAGYKYGDVVKVYIAGKKISMPIVNDSQDVAEGKPALVVSDKYISLVINDGSFAEKYGIAVKSDGKYGWAYAEGITGPVKVSVKLKEAGGYADEYEIVFPSWNSGSESLKELVDFVRDTTDETSTNYIEPAERIAVFDMDGTILCEKAPVYVDYCLTMYRVLDDSNYNASDEERDSMQQIRDHAYSEGKTFKPAGLKKDDMVASAFAGMTPEEFRAYVVEFADSTDAVGFSGMTYGQSFYKPMIEVIDFLRDSGYDVWMVSACEREVVRALVERYGIPYDHVVATDVPYVTSGKGEDVAADDYNMSKDEVILLGAPLDEVECGKSGKSAAIAREIGRRPVLAFGNSSGDYSMLNYAEGNTVHPGMGFFVVCDDTVREYGSDEKAAEYYAVVESEGWTAISMANDWKTIYGDGVQKIGLPGAEMTDAA